MPHSAEGRNASDPGGRDFLLTDVDLALTFLDVADTTAVEETAHRNREHARQAYGTVANFLTKLNLKVADREAVETRLAVLKERLDAAGYGP